MLPRRSSQIRTAPRRAVVVFALDGRHFAVAADRVVEVANVASYTPLPCENPAHLGVVLHREALVPWVDLGWQVGVCRPDRLQSPGLCLFLNTDSGEVACPVDRVLGLTAATDERLWHHSILPGGVSILCAGGWEEHHGQAAAR